MIEIPLAGGRLVAAVDDADADLARLRWLPDHAVPPFVIRRVAGRVVRLHHVVARRAYGPTPAGLYVDHLNGRHLDCRRENLQVVTKTVLSAHAHLRRMGSLPTAHKGVGFCPDTGRYRAAIVLPGEGWRHIGFYDTAEDALGAWRRAFTEAHGIPPRA